MEEQNFTKNEISIPSMSEDKILEMAKQIDPKSAAKEILNWLIDNVTNYVDNHKVGYRLYLTVNAHNSMPSTGLLQLLYMSIPQVIDEKDFSGKEVEGRCLDVLEDVTLNVKNEIFADKEALKTLFDKLIYYYEMTGFSSQSGPIIQQFDGYVEMSEFIYEPISMEVVVSEGEDIVDSSGNHIGQSKPKSVVKREMMPEGFSIEFELKYWRKVKPSLY